MSEKIIVEVVVTATLGGLFQDSLEARTIENLSVQVTQQPEYLKIDVTDFTKTLVLNMAKAPAHNDPRRSLFSDHTLTYKRSCAEALAQVVLEFHDRAELVSLNQTETVDPEEYTNRIIVTELRFSIWE